MMNCQQPDLYGLNAERRSAGFETEDEVRHELIWQHVRGREDRKLVLHDLREEMRDFVGEVAPIVHAGRVVGLVHGDRYGTGRALTEPTYEIMQRSGRLVGRAAASVCNVLDLDLVVVGGSVASGFGATFFNSAQETLDEHAKLSFSRGARITPVRLGDRGPLVGAGAVAVRGIHRSRRAASVRAARGTA